MFTKIPHSVMFAFRSDLYYLLLFDFLIEIFFYTEEHAECLIIKQKCL